MRGKGEVEREGCSQRRKESKKGNTGTWSFPLAAYVNVEWLVVEYESRPN